MTVRAFVAGLLLALLAPAGAARAQLPGDRPDVYIPPHTHGHERGSSYYSDEQTGFLLGGMGLWSGVDMIGLSWSAGAGLDIPMHAWSIVPRLDFDGVGGGGDSNGWMARVTVGGRIATEYTGHVTYLEAGPGVMRYDVTPSDVFGTGPVPRREEFAACFEFTTGTMSDPNFRPGLLLEATFVAAAKRNAPSTLVGRVGIRF